jgi:hypothetical protein
MKSPFTVRLSDAKCPDRQEKFEKLLNSRGANPTDVLRELVDAYIRDQATTPFPVRLEPIEHDGNGNVEPQHSLDEINPTGTRLLYISDVEPILRKSRKSIYKLSNRKRNPLPLTRGKGRPFIVENALYRWLHGEPIRRPLI